MVAPAFEIFETNGIRLRVALAGKGPLVVLVHGWPESWYSWRHQIAALAAAGYRVAAPDGRGYGGGDKTRAHECAAVAASGCRGAAPEVRGYGGSHKPEPIEAYSIKEMCTDIAGLIDG